MEYLLDLAPLIAILVALFGLLVWWRRRSDRKQERQHTEALAALADRLGGRVVGSTEARAWSADLLPPLLNETEGVVNRIGTVRRPRFDTALDFQRGNWWVRVSEASTKKHVVTAGTRTIHQHRIDVATSALPPMKISRRVHVDFKGRPVPLGRTAGPVAEPPPTATREQHQWLEAGLPEPLAREFAVFTTDPATTRAFTPQVVEWMLEQTDDNPFLGPMPLLLTLEAGVAYTTAPHRVDPEQIVRKVDAILGLLDRLGAKPATPPVTRGVPEPR